MLSCVSAPRTSAHNIIIDFFVGLFISTLYPTIIISPFKCIFKYAKLKFSKLNRHYHYSISKKNLCLPSDNFTLRWLMRTNIFILQNYAINIIKTTFCWMVKILHLFASLISSLFNQGYFQAGCGHFGLSLEPPQYPAPLDPHFK